MKLVGVIFLLGLLAGCGDTQPASQAVAKVGESTLYQDQIDYRLQRFSAEARRQIEQDKSQYTELIKSVAYAKLMADKQWQTLSVEQQRFIDLQVAAYRTDLLSRKHLEENLPAKQPSHQQIEEYYHKHSELFANKEYQLQIIGVREGCSIAPELLVKYLDEAQFNQLMSSECSSLLGNKTFSRSELQKLFSIQQSIENRHAYWAQQNDSAQLFFVENITEEAKPLPTVVNEIRETLAAKNFKEAFDKYRTTLSKEIELLN